MIEIIPAMDIIDGKCVRLLQGDFLQKTEYGDDPVDAAMRFRDAGLTRLHMVDLDGARSGVPNNLATLERVAKNSGMQIDFGGGVRNDADVDNALSAGAAMINVTSVAASDPERFHRWLEKFGTVKFVLGADTRSGYIAANGWKSDTKILVNDFIRRYVDAGILDVFVTDIGRDGMLSGLNIELYRQVISKVKKLKLTASGGVRSMADIAAAAEVGCSGVIVGKALYEGRISLREISSYVGKANNSLPGR
jgi:phosphoribosylformimino-5-aminoimidazole carboxamide ribotide isomerase